MKSNQTLFLVVIAALGILAAYLWVSKPGKQPAPVVKVAAPAKPDVAPVAPPTPTKVPQPMGHVVSMPVNPTQTGELPPMREGRAFYGKVDTMEQLNKLLDETVKATGGEALEKTLLAAKWRLIVTLPSRALFLEMQTDVDGDLMLRDEKSGDEWYLVHDECRFREGKLVATCLKEQEDFIHGLMLGELSAVPLRLKHAHLTIENVIDTKDVVYVGLPEVVDHPPIRAQISRENGSVLRTLWSTITASPERNRLDEDWGTPIAWSIDSSPIDIDGKPKENVKRDMHKLIWQEAVRVVEVKPSKEKALIKLPELTGPEPMSIVSRPAMSVVALPLSSHNKINDARNRIMSTLGFEGMIDLRVYEALAPAAQTPKLDHGVEIWIALPPQGIALQTQKDPVKEIPAEAKVAREVIRCAWNDIPDQMVKFVGEVTAAGHTPGPGPTLMHPVSADRQESMVVELLIPLVK